jgi:hypothetical protein
MLLLNIQKSYMPSPDLKPYLLCTATKQESTRTTTMTTITTYYNENNHRIHNPNLQQKQNEFKIYRTGLPVVVAILI